MLAAKPRRLSGTNTVSQQDLALSTIDRAIAAPTSIGARLAATQPASVARVRLGRRMLGVAVSLAAVFAFAGAPAAQESQPDIHPALPGSLLPIHAALEVAAFTTQRTPNPITATCIDPENKPNAQGGWARLYGADFRTDTAGKADFGGSMLELDSETRTRFGILQGGFDHVLCDLDGNGGNLHLGVTGGKIWGSSRQSDPDPLNGIFGSDIDFDTWFVGPYAAYTRDKLAIQGALRFDHHSLDLSNPTAGISAVGIEFDASSVTGTASVSHDFELGDLTLTPEIGVNVSNTKIDDFGIAGGTAALDDLWSAIGHAGVTARTTIAVTDKVFVIPFAAATLYHEFVEDAAADLIFGQRTVEVGANRVGTFGQLGIGANAVRLGNVVTGHPTVFGGARFDLVVGERIEGATATVFTRIQF